MKFKFGKMRNNSIKCCFCALIVLAMAATGCRMAGPQMEMEEEPEAIAVDVETTTPSYEDIAVSGTFIGTIETGTVVSIYPQINAKVIQKNFEVGDYVNEGDLLFVLDDSSLQIEKRNAQASVKSAEASLTAQKANNLATQAAATESIESIATTEYEKAKAINSAEREESAARTNESKNLQQAELSNADAERALSQYNTASDQLESATSYYNYLCEIKEEYVRLYRINPDSAEAYMAKTSYLSYEDFSAALEAAKGVVDSATSEKLTQQGNYSSSMSQKIEASANAEVESGTIANAQEAKVLAEKMFMDYELYTKNSIITEANSKVAEGEANVVASDSTLESAKAAKDLVDLQLSYTNVTSPISGIIDEINIVQYGMASDQSAAYVISGQGNRKIVFDVPGETLKNIEMGQSVTIESDSMTYRAVVTKINDSLQQGAKLFRVEAAIQDVKEIEFAIGTKVKLETCVERKQNILTIPIEALFYSDGKPYVYVIEDGKAIRRNVETGISNDTSIEILSGIDERASVITSWSASLRDQAVVNVIKNANAESADDMPNDLNNDMEAVDISRETNAMKNPPEDGGVPVRTTVRVNIRKQPAANAAKVAVVDAGTELILISEEGNGWSRIVYNDTEAYIKSEYIKEVQ